MQDYRQLYIELIAAKIDALESARNSWSSKDPEALKTIRGLSHDLVGSGGTYGFQEISDAAVLVEEAEEENVSNHLDALLTLLRELSSNKPKDKNRILIVTDDDSLHGSLREGLFAMDRDLLFADSVKKACKLVDEKKLDLILVDMTLGDTQSKLFLEWVQKQKQIASVPILILTDADLHEQSDSFDIPRISGFFEPPFDMAKISKTAEELIQGRNKNSGRFGHDWIKTSPTQSDPPKSSRTAVLNRDEFERSFTKQLASILENNEPTSLGLIDLDRFVSVNENFGWATGDAVLAQFASFLSESTRRHDIVGRWDGNQFMILFCNLDRDSSAHFLKGILGSMRLKTFAAAGTNTLFLNFTATVADVHNKTQLEQAIGKLSRVVKQGKKKGGDQVVIPKTTGRSDQKRILVVEDDELTANFIKNRLLERGFVVHHTVNGKTGLKIAREYGISMAILDVKLPGMNGFEVLSELKNTAGHENIPIIMLTAYRNQEDVRRGIQLGTDEYIVKPFNPDKLIATINRLLREKEKS